MVTKRDTGNTRQRRAALLHLSHCIPADSVQGDQKFSVHLTIASSGAHRLFDHPVFGLYVARNA
jgi:hypothetical protein